MMDLGVGFCVNRCKFVRFGILKIFTLVSITMDKGHSTLMIKFHTDDLVECLSTQWTWNYEDLNILYSVCPGFMHVLKQKI